MEIWVLVAGAALFFEWVVGIAEIAGTPDDGFASGTRTAWLLIVILTGIVGLVAYVLVGKQRDAEPGDGPPLAGGHSIKRSGSRWICREYGCLFYTAFGNLAREHRIETGAIPKFTAATSGTAPPPPDRVAGFNDPPLPTAARVESSERPDNPLAEMKTCPDCAEEIRLAARKCRFCGYQFESADLSG